MSDAVFPISATTLQLWFDPGTFQRARAYWQAGKVIKLEYNEELTQITAQVSGRSSDTLPAICFFETTWCRVATDRLLYLPGEWAL